jgi:hypothetical protein
MKTLRASFILFALIFSASAFAQYGQGYGNGMGSGRMNGGMTVPQAGSGSSKKAEKPDYIEETVKFYTKELKLDDFQAAAVREAIKSHMDELTALAQDTDMTLDEKKDRAHVINEKIDAEIIRLLSDEQKEKFKKLQEKRKK